MVFTEGITATPGHSEMQRRKLLGNAFDLNAVSCLLAVTNALNARSTHQPTVSHSFATAGTHNDFPVQAPLTSTDMKTRYHKGYDILQKMGHVTGRTIGLEGHGLPWALQPDTVRCDTFGIG